MDNSKKVQVSESEKIESRVEAVYAAPVIAPF
jgi:hypothetical protein